MEMPEKTLKRLNDHIEAGLRSSNSYVNGRLTLGSEKPFVKRVIDLFDFKNINRLYPEAKALAEGQTSTADTSLPIHFQRTVIKQALSDLNILDIVQTLTDPQATTTTEIPYELRDISALRNNGIVPEGGAIYGASIRQDSDTAYLQARKLSMSLTNEVIHFSSVSNLNWDAYGRNVESNARVIRELAASSIANNIQRNADMFGAVAITGEDISSQLSGSKSTIKTESFPLVAQHQEKNIRGDTIGELQNAIVIKINGQTIPEFDGTGNQAAGTYYYISNYNLGYVSFVNKSGTPVTPTHSSGATEISYTTSTNIVKFDLDIPPGADVEKHLNGLLRKIGERKSFMQTNRFIQPDFMLMSPILNDTCTNAEQFAAERNRNGSNTDSSGDLETIKGVPVFGTNAPGIHLGNERIIMGVRGTTSYTIAKPFVMGKPFEAVDTEGNPTGHKLAYGEEYAAIHTPPPIRNRYTSVIAYSVTARAAV